MTTERPTAAEAVKRARSMSATLSGAAVQAPKCTLDEFGVDQGWSTVEKHPRFLLTTTGDGAADIVGFGGPGVYVARDLCRRFRTRWFSGVSAAAASRRLAVGAAVRPAPPRKR
ncbi:hypothetical protein [Streptomyces sp. NPDC101234]|uniref:hypothetical protein n=1 Tax=Streptomyces sp. NPDC101234 TaxID=3366138 RepID=UPI003806E8F8